MRTDGSSRAAEHHRRTLRVALFKDRRDRLVEVMGSVCAIEECPTPWDQLEFDHPNGRGYDPAKLNRWTRMKRYREDWLAGNLRLLCKTHNTSDGAKRRWHTTKTSERS